MELAHFIPDYPDVSADDFYDDIYRKKEFYDLAAKDGASASSKHGDRPFFDHQDIIARFISHWTLYTSLFLVHDTGTGKSASATAVFDGLVQYRPDLKTLYLSNNDTLLENFRTEILRRSPYLQQKWKVLTEKVEVGQDNFVLYRNRVLREANIHFYTYSRFGSLLAKGRTHYVTLYQNSLIIMDEVHHLIVHELDNVKALDTTYHEIHTFVHAVSKKKLLIMTATPMRNAPREIVPLLNLLLPLNQQFPTSEAFENEYFTRNTASILPVLEWRPTMETRFKRQVQGYVSVVKKRVDVKVRYRGIIYPPMKHFPLSAHVMSTHQTLAYERALLKDTEMSTGKKKLDASFYSNSVQASLMVFPDGTYGIKNTQKYFGGNGLSAVFYTESGLRRRASSPEEVKTNLILLQKLSATYAHIIRQIVLHPHKLFYVYCDKINGSGLWTCVLLLIQCFRFSLVKSTRNFDWKQPMRRCIFLNDTGTGTTKTDIPKLIETFNDPRNRFGDHIQVIFGTDKTREGITLKNIGSIHVVSPDWNFGKIYQAIGRGVRLLSHEALGKDAEVDIFFHCAVPSVDMTSPLNLLAEVEVDTGAGMEVEAETEDDVPVLEPDLSLTSDSKPVSATEQNEWDWLDEALDQDDEMRLLQEEQQDVSFTPRQLGHSIDYYKYIRSELRDYNIKLVEYALLTSAFDCQLNYANNFDRLGTDGSSACLYRPCRYECDGITEVVPTSLDTSTFDLFYVKDSVNRVMEMIKDIFSTTFSVSLAHIMDRGSQHKFTLSQIVETLHLVMGVPIPLQSRDGRKLYLTRNDDTFFLIADRNVLTWVHNRNWLSSYAKTPSFEAFATFSDLSRTMTDYRPIFTDFFETLVQKRDPEGVRLYWLLSVTVQNEVVKVILQTLNDRVESEWVQWALQHLYKDDIVQMAPHGWVYLIDKLPAMVVDGEFVFVDKESAQQQQQQEPNVVAAVDSTTEDHESAEFIAKYITNNPLKRYAYLKNGTLKIRDVQKDAKDQKSKTTGMSCTSHRTSDLLHIMWNLGGRFPAAPPPVTAPKKIIDAHRQLSNASKKDLDAIFETLTSNDTSKKTWQEFSTITPVPKTERENRIRFFLYYLLMKRTELCVLLQRLFVERGLLTKAPTFSKKVS